MSSAIFWAAKWFDQQMVTINLEEISWAWGFLPLMVWFFIAYLRRWQKYQKIEAERNSLKQSKDYEAALDQLSEFFDRGNNEIFNADPVASDFEYRAWRKKWSTWMLEVQGYLHVNFVLSDRNLCKMIVIY